MTTTTIDANDTTVSDTRHPGSRWAGPIVIGAILALVVQHFTIMPSTPVGPGGPVSVAPSPSRDTIQHQVMFLFRGTGGVGHYWADQQIAIAIIDVPATGKPDVECAISIDGLVVTGAAASKRGESAACIWTAATTPITATPITPTS